MLMQTSIYSLLAFYLYKQGGKILTGGSIVESDGNFVDPTIVEISPSASVVKEELFAPVLYVMKIKVLYIFFKKFNDRLFFISITILCFIICRIWKKQLN